MSRRKNRRHTTAHLPAIRVVKSTRNGLDASYEKIIHRPSVFTEREILARLRAEHIAEGG
jgi:hypothetical protein